jgi:NADH-quinone oxidoreductase subunit M
MTDFSFPWLSFLAGWPLLVAAAVWATRRSTAASHAAGLAATLGCVPAALAAWIDLGRGRATDPLLPWLAADDLSAPLLLCIAITVSAVHLTTPRARRSPSTAGRTLVSASLLFATFSSSDPWALAILFAAGMVPSWLELAGSDRRAARVFALYMGAAAAAFAVGVAAGASTWGWIPLAAAVLIRKGIVPLHSWMPPFFQGARLPTIVLFSMPQVGTYCAARLLAPAAPPAAMEWVAVAALSTAVYAASLALAQKETRRMFGFVFMSQSALVLAGLGCGNVAGVAGGLTLWVSSALALSGFGVTLRALEARRGELALDRFHGGYERMPLLAACFLILGMACVGIPGTLGFVAEELLVDGASAAFPAFGFLAAVATAFNGVTVFRAYASLFCGARSDSTQERLRPRERAAVLALAALLLAGGIWPGPLVEAGEAAARVLVGQ